MVGPGSTPGHLNIAISVHGTPGAMVEVQLWASPVLSAQFALGEDGAGVANLDANPGDVGVDAEVGVRYIVDGVPGEWSKAWLVWE